MQAINIIKEIFIKFYEYLFQLVTINLFSFLILLLPFSLLGISSVYFVLFLSIFISAILAGPVILSGMDYINKILNREDVGIKGFLAGIKVNFLKGVSSFFFMLVTYLVILLDIYFFMQRSDNFLMMVIGIMFFYILIFFSLFQFYFWPLRVMKELRFFDAVKQAFLLVMDNFLVTFLLFIFILIIIIIIIIISLYVPFIMPFFFITFLSLTSVILTRTILEKYKEQE